MPLPYMRSPPAPAPEAQVYLEDINRGVMELGGQVTQRLGAVAAAPADLVLVE